MQSKKRKNIPLNKKVVFEAANRLAAVLKMPTIKDLRAELGGSGSETTLHKYLNQWKTELLRTTFTKKIENISDSQKSGILSDDKRALEQAFNQELSAKKALSAELIKSEKENLNLKAQNQQLEKDLKSLTEAHKMLTNKCEHLEKLCQAITEERKTVAAAVLQVQAQKIEALQQELRQVNKDNLEQIKKMGFAADDAIIAEKVKVINLEDKMKIVVEQVKALQKALKAEKEANELLRQKLKVLTQKTVSQTSSQAQTLVSEG